MERRDDTPLPVPDTGEPKIVQKTRAYFARWAAISAGCFMVNIATGIGEPWFLFPMMGMGFGLVTHYSKLWQAGYTWRDVLSRPPAPDARLVPGGKGHKGVKQIAAPTRDEFGTHQQAVSQAFGDRTAIYKLLDRMTPAERQMLPEDVASTVDGLYLRASELARTLQAMDSNVATEDLGRIKERIAALSREPDDEERTRRLALLERQEKAIRDLGGRRDQIAGQFESCCLAMQNVRFDLLRLRSADAAAALGDLTMATQQARALSRDVDNAIVAASEIREVLGK
jgi:hypothetical protein